MLTYGEVPTLVGDRLLETLEHYSNLYDLGLVFHGGKRALQVLEPQIPCWAKGDERYPDSAYPVICAEERILLAAFFAVSPRGNSMAYGNEAGGIDFTIRPQAAQDFYTAEGYVAVLDRLHFSVFRSGPPQGWPDPCPPRSPELRSAEAQAPFCNVAVTSADFMRILASSPNSKLKIADF